MKGFTLIELLIVIAILAILTTAVVLVLNPAQLLAEARDAQRMADLDSVRSAIVLYLATATSTTVQIGPYSTADAACAFTTCTRMGVYTIDGNGWVGVDLRDTSGGSPLAVLPRDPVNGTCTPGSGAATICQYAYKGDAVKKTFELDAVLESTKYGAATTGKMAIDGGNTVDYYEIGTDPDLNL